MLPIGERIRALRRERNITQEELASALGVSYQAVSRWEKGDAYPDIELLPKIGLYFSVTTDRLLGADEETRQAEREKALEDYLNRITKVSGTKEHFETMRQAFAEFPDHPEFAYHALNDLVEHRCLPREEALPIARELGNALIGTSYQQHAVRFLYQYEDEDQLERWTHLTLQEYTVPRLHEERYAYWGLNDECSRQRQINLLQDLNYLIWNDLGKKTPDGKEDSASWNEGLHCALKLIDCLRDPSTDEDGWIDERLWIYLRIASNDFFMDRKEEGYEALEKAAALLEIIAAYPPEHRFSFHTRVLDLIHGSVMNDFSGGSDITGRGDCRANYFKIIESIVGTEHGWFAPVREEVRYKAIAARVREFSPGVQPERLIISYVHVSRLYAFGWDRTE